MNRNVRRRLQLRLTIRGSGICNVAFTFRDVDHSLIVHDVSSAPRRQRPTSTEGCLYAVFWLRGFNALCFTLNTLDNGLHVASVLQKSPTDNLAGLLWHLGDGMADP